jgi:RHS repeat-associated protein
MSRVLIALLLAIGLLPATLHAASHPTYGAIDAQTDLARSYFGARYYVGTSGRFTSPDPIQGRLADPQTLNRYAYSKNNPLRFVDPTGLYVVDAACLEDKQCAGDARRFEQERQRALRSSNGDISAAAGAYGNLGDANGVTLNFGNRKAVEAACGQGAAGCARSSYVGDAATGAMNPAINVLIQSGFSGTALQRTLVHEGSHVGDALGFVRSWDLGTMSFDAAKNLTMYSTEFRAYQLETLVDLSTPHPLRGQLPAGTASLIDGFLRKSALYGPRLNNWMFDPTFTKPR